MLNFSDAEKAELAENSIMVGGTLSDAASLALGWAEWIAKIDGQRSLPPEDHSVWTEHDLVGAMHFRDYVEDALAALPAPLRAKIQPAVDATDERLTSFTTEDTGERMVKVAREDLTGRGWWWRRIPVDGPIAGFIAESWYD